jgi:plastocyanin
VFNTAAKLHFGLAALALVLAIGYQATTGDRSGGVLFFFLMAAALLAGLAETGATIDDSAPWPPADSVPPQESVAVDPSLQPAPSAWPMLLAAAVGVLAIGAAAGHYVVIVGAVGALLAVFGGLAQAFREDPSHTPTEGARVTDRAVAPFLLPLTAFGLVAVLVISVSRVLLAVPKAASVAIALAVAIIVLLGFALIAARPRASSTILATVAGVAVASVIAAGAVGAATGERKFETPALVRPQVVVLSAKNLTFDLTAIGVTVNKPVTLHFTNLDKTYHNVAVYTAPTGGTPIIDGQPVLGVGHRTYQWTFSTPGQFNFRCDFHPSMVGTFTVAGS